MFNRSHLPPGPSLFSQIGNLPSPKEKLKTLTDLMYRYGDLVKIPSFLNIFLVNHIETIEEILLHRPLEFNKKNLIYQHLGKFLGKGGLLISEEDHWKNRRRLLQPAFHRQALAQAAPFIVDTTHKMLEKWQSTDTNKNLAHEMLTLTLNISGAILFSEDLTLAAPKILKWINTGHRTITNSILINRFIPTPNSILFHHSLNHMDQFARSLIHKRRKNRGNNQDLLTLLLDAKDEQGKALDDQNIIDEIKTFLVTGHETAGYALAWVFWHLTQHADVLAKVVDEVDTVLGSRKATFEDVSQLTYLRRVIEETMRMCPPIWVFTRKNIHSFKVQNYTIPANSNLIICAYTLHRHPLYWPLAEKFDPDRFLPENVAKRPKLAYLPFGAGPRGCIAGSFSMLKITLILATMLQHVVIQNRTREALQPKPLFSFKQNRPFWVSIKNRYQ